jgi:hypothetical protein
MRYHVSSGALDIAGSPEALRRMVAGILRDYPAVARRWHDYTIANPKESTMTPRPEHNPHRDHGTDSHSVATPTPTPDRGLGTMHGRAEAHATFAEGLPGRLANAYDRGWQAGMFEQHEGTAAAFGPRIHLLDELLDLLPLAPEDPATGYREVIDLTRGVLASIVAEHDRGAHAKRDPERAEPTFAGGGENATDEEASHAARVAQLREWLGHYVAERDERIQAVEEAIFADAAKAPVLGDPSDGSNLDDLVELARASGLAVTHATGDGDAITLHLGDWGQAAPST